MLTLGEILKACRDNDERKAIIEHLAFLRMRKTLRLIDKLSDLYPDAGASPETSTSAGTSAESTTAKTVNPTCLATVGVIATTLIEDW